MINGFGYSVAPASLADPTILKTNFQAYYKAGSSFAAWAGLWYLYVDATLGLGHTAVEGVDYVSSIRVNPATFPNGSEIIWRVPDQAPAYAGVYGYLGQQYGNYQWTYVDTAITPRQVYTITTLTTVFDFTYSSADDSSVLEEMWLTNAARPNATEVDAYRTHELGVFRRTSAGTISYMAGKTQVGTYNDGARNWTVAVDMTITPPFIMLRPADGADFTGEISWPAIFAYLVAHGRITGNEYYNGHSCGVEPSRGSGTCKVHTQTTSYAGAARVPWTIADLTATAQSSSTILLGYTAAAGATAHQYRVNGGTWTAMPGDRIVTGLSASTSYAIEVRGTNATGNAAASNTASATTSAAGAAELLTNGGFSDGETGWTGFWYSGKTIDYDNGRAVFASSPAYDGISQPVTVEANKFYEIQFTVVSRSAGSIFPRLVGGTARNGTARNAPGTYTQRLYANAGNDHFELTPYDSGFSGVVDNVSLKGPYTTATVGGA